MAVLALGKLGGEELGYAADLDLVFVYSADGETEARDATRGGVNAGGRDTGRGDRNVPSIAARPLSNVEYMTRLAQRMMSGLHAQHERGRLYEVDTRLRPSGSRGLLVSSLSAWRRYHQEEARLWERQALIKVRPVAGDARLGAEVAEVAASCVWGGAASSATDAATIAREVTAMRDRIEQELASGSGDLKAGRGGLIDVEFAAQALQLVFGGEEPTLRTRQTVGALAAATQRGVADAGDCALLIDGYRFLRRLEHRMRIVHDRSVHRLPDAPRDLELLARRAGFPDGATLRASFERWTHDIRAAYQRVMGSLDPSAIDR
jgi:glutamate-ammonia-ligase adenylyltransferase